MGKKVESAAPGVAVVKAAALACAASLALILIYSLALWQEWLPLSTANVATVVMKVLSAALAGFMVVRKVKCRAWLYGALAGLVYAVAAHLLFMLLSDSVRISLSALTDAVTGAVSGALAAMIAKAIK